MRAIYEASEGNYGVPHLHHELRKAGLGGEPQAGAAADATTRHRPTASSPPVPDHVPGADGYVIADLVGRGSPAWPRSRLTHHAQSRFR
jgi:hypothetical protein